MATWKEKGEVLDSEDGESIDGQSDASFEDTIIEEEPEKIDHTGNGIQAQAEDADLGMVEAEQTQVEKPGEKTATIDEVVHHANILASSGRPHNLAGAEHDGTNIPSSPPVLKRVFRDPRDLWDLDIGSSQSARFLSTPALEVADEVLPVQDEVSECYVRLTSPMSSALSSPPSTPRTTHSPSTNGQTPKDSSRGSPAQRAQETIDPPVEAFEEHVIARRRALRQRNPIQLHPYVVENEKYRQTLMSRGLAPMRIAQTPDGHITKGRHTVRSHEESEEEDSQGAYQQISQALVELDWGTDPSFPAPRSAGVSQESRSDDSVFGNSGGEDEEFPELDALLRQPRSLHKPLQSNRPSRSYPTKLNRPKTIRAQYPTVSKEWPNNSFHVPASPPATSSAAPKSRKAATRSVSVSSKEPTPIWLDEDELAVEPPTPATSVVNPVPDTFWFESDDESDDPFALVSDVILSKSSQESVEVRKVAKKIRGVLPASHLRLDHQLNKNNTLSRTQRQSLSLSPAKQQPRRGVAHPKFSKTGQTQRASTNNDFPVFFNESDESDDGKSNNGVNAFVSEDDHNDLDGTLSEEHTRDGEADEDDGVDHMLSRKRQGRRLNPSSRKKKRVGSSSTLPGDRSAVTSQPKITRHLNDVVNPTRVKSVRHRKTTRTSQHGYGTISCQNQIVPSELSILDIAFTDENPAPQFIKIAARTARSKKGQGRQSPTRKFIRLATREDTHDAQSMLYDWRNGKLNALGRGFPQNQGNEAPLGQIANNRQARLPSPLTRRHTRVQSIKHREDTFESPRSSTTTTHNPVTITHSVSCKGGVTNRARPVKRVSLALENTTHRLQHRVYQARPAQLELSETEYSSLHPAAAFTNTKKTLDSLYRMKRKQQTLQVNLQLGRFLADVDNARPPTEAKSAHELNRPQPASESSIHPRQLVRCRKKPPQRVDIGTATYRQPSEPLVLEHFPSIHDVSSGDKLTGLGPFGTRYPIHFDILPLQTGIYFNDSTFIGSRRLSDIINRPLSFSESIPPFLTFRLGEKTLQWGVWNEDVSSEVGLCFDWLLDRLGTSSLSSESMTVHDEPTHVITYLIDYIQYNISFTSPEHRNKFLLRMAQVVQEFLAQLNAKDGDIDPLGQKSKVEVISRCLVLVFGLLRLARGSDELITTASKLEKLLIEVATYSIQNLLFIGLDVIRKLYETLQYLSFREGGIDSSNYAAEAWIIVMKILKVVRIPRQSFWDLTNFHLLKEGMAAVSDAKMMERTWYNVFSLLPLCEFDDFGVVAMGSRHCAVFDNWTMPQQILKRLFALCSSSSRQPPGFNEYCRATVSRCHYLIVEWGWWNCSGVIGTVFDYFASKNLAHLRNEEVHRSPQFLEKLDTDPSLAVELEDRCFHILLKIIVLKIRHMTLENGGKGIRNLVTRLLPNHNRRYPKEEPILERELAALRNHHDLLCTLYWASPPDYRPSLSLIQDLVDADHSHHAACLINIRAWEYLARFVLAPSTSPESFRPFLEWQDAFFAKVWTQLVEEEVITRQEARNYQASDLQLISEARVQQQIVMNRVSTMTIIVAVLRTNSMAIDSARDPWSLLATFNTRLLQKGLSILDTLDWKEPSMLPNVEGIVLGSLGSLGQYLDKVDKILPYRKPFEKVDEPMGVSIDNDSQDSFGWDTSLSTEREMLVAPLREMILPGFFSIAMRIIDCRLYSGRPPAHIDTLVNRWADFASILTEASLPLRDFLPGGIYAVFSQRHGGDRANRYWPLFICGLLKYKSIEELKTQGLDIQLEWILALTVPPSEHHTEGEHITALTSAMKRREDPLTTYLTAGRPGILSRVGPVNEAILINAIENMRRILNETTDASEARQIRSRFSFILKELMETMQRYAESMKPRSQNHLFYVDFCQNIVKYIRSRASGIQPVSAYFTVESMTYWPAMSDPKLYGAGVTSYALRLENQPTKVSSELFHYLYSDWRNSFMLGQKQLQRHAVHVKEGMKYWAFTQFMLTSFIPAALHVGFAIDHAWVIPLTYLPVMVKRIGCLLRKGGFEGAETLRLVVNLLKIIMNGIVHLNKKWFNGTRGANSLPFNAIVHDIVVPMTATSAEDRVLGVHADHRGMISVASQFWLVIYPDVKEYLTHHVVEAKVNNSDEVIATFENFVQMTIRSFSGHVEEGDEGIWERSHFVVKEGPYEQTFVDKLTEDIKNNWLGTSSGVQSTLGTQQGDWRAVSMRDGRGFIHMPRRGAREDEGRVPVSLVGFWPPTLYEVLRSASVTNYFYSVRADPTRGLEEWF